MSELFQIRHGDVFLMQIDESVEGEIVPRKNGRIVLAEGEVTNHFHTIETEQVDLVQMFQDHFLVAKQDFDVKHILPDGSWTGDHNDIQRIPAGTFKVIHQREQFPEGVRLVID